MSDAELFSASASAGLATATSCSLVSGMTSVAVGSLEVSSVTVWLLVGGSLGASRSASSKTELGLASLVTSAGHDSLRVSSPLARSASVSAAPSQSL